MSTRSARRRIWIWCLAAVSLLALALPAAASAETFLGAIDVPLDGSKVYSAPLVAGGVYRIDASGTYTQTVGIDLDAIYCYFSANPVPGTCSPPGHSYLVIVRYEGDTSLTADLDALNPATTLAYNSQHTYQETFTAPSSSRLEVFYRSFQPSFFSGAIRLDLYLVSLPPAPGPSGGPSPGSGSPATQVTRRVLDPPTSWGQAGPATALAPGDEVVVPSPRIAPGQREASVTVSGDPTGKIAVAAKLSAKDCLWLFIIERFKQVPDYRDLNGQIHTKSVREEDDDEFFLSLLGMLACLEELREANSRAQRSAAPHVAAARSRCGRSLARVKVRLDRASRTARFKVRPTRRGPSRRLRVSCRPGPNGALTMHIRTASRRTKLRQVVGRRLVVGVYRAREASGKANIRATFKRR